MFAIVPAVALAIGLAGCGGDDAPKASTVQADLVVVARTTAWEKPAYELAAGTKTIELKNDDLVGHNLHVLDTGNKDMGTVIDANPGNTATGSFALTPGTYRIFCSIPGHSNMDSTLTVK